VIKVLQIGRSPVRSQLVSLEIFVDIKSFRSHYGPGVDSASNRNEYREYFLRGKGGRCVRLTTLPPSCAIVTRSGNLKFLEPSGPVQACNGTDLPLPPSCVVVTRSGNLKFLEPSGPVQACNGTDLPLPILTEYQCLKLDDYKLPTRCK